MNRRLLLGYLGLTLFVLVALEVPLGIRNSQTERRDLEAKVERDAVALASIADDALRLPSASRLDAVGSVAYRYRRDTGGRVVVVDGRGVAVIDTDPAESGVTSFADRPEIRAALAGMVATGTRYSRTAGGDLLYVAVPVASGGRVDGAVRITYPTSAVDARILRYWLVLAGIALVVLSLAAALGIGLARFVTGPLRGVEDAAAAVGAGDLGARAPVDEGPPEVRSLARVFNDTVAKTEQLLRSQQEFVADASHQLRTPLTALRLRLENLDHELGADGRSTLTAAVAEVDRLAALVEQLLALARADSAAEPVAEIDVASLLRERAGAWSALAEEHGLAFELGADRPGRALAGAERLRNALDTLIENAIQASPPGGRIVLGAVEVAPWIEISVRDHGPGLSPEDRERAFGRFWRGRSGGEGSGLGLAIAKRLVESDGGAVELRDAPGGGLEAVLRVRAADR
ncbi:MAG TPA: HAMP domain-containing sensor histidine kinase [Gaiellaceae bacterium]|nr:HAMP domain-containing sensor histidine kinase [Gaiellaceae bacterium]